MTRSRVLMTRLVVLAVVCGVVLGAQQPARAGAKGVGLGLSMGAVFPNGGDVAFEDVGLNWGFWVDIPIAWRFHIAPSAEIYNIGGKVDQDPATDINLNFKFILPMGGAKFFVAGSGGVTVAWDYSGNVGVLAGFSFPVTSGLEAFASAKYKVVIEEPNLHMIHTNVGFLFVF